jgi:hypothetical protein
MYIFVRATAVWGGDVAIKIMHNSEYNLMGYREATILRCMNTVKKIRSNYNNATSSLCKS